MAITTSAVANSPGVLVYARYNARTAHIETIGTLFNNTQEVGSGSGLLLADNFVLTNNHVIPPENNYQTLVVNVRLKSRNVSPLPVVRIYREWAATSRYWSLHCRSGMQATEPDVRCRLFWTPAARRSGPSCTC